MDSTSTYLMTNQAIEVDEAIVETELKSSEIITMQKSRNTIVTNL